MKNANVKPAVGRLGILIVGNGAVATTFVTGVLLARRGLGKPIGSMTQYDRVRVRDNNCETIKDKRYLHYGEIVPLAKLDDLVFGCWDGALWGIISTSSCFFQRRSQLTRTRFCVAIPFSRAVEPRTPCKIHLQDGASTERLASARSRSGLAGKGNECTVLPVS